MKNEKSFPRIMDFVKSKIYNNIGVFQKIVFKHIIPNPKNRNKTIFEIIVLENIYKENTK